MGDLRRYAYLIVANAAVHNTITQDVDMRLISIDYYFSLTFILISCGGATLDSTVT